MTQTLLDLHAQHFSPREGCFSNQLTASLVAERLGRFLSANGFAVPSRYIQVVKSGRNFTIEIPRIRHVWWPKHNDSASIGAELAEINRLVKEANP